MRGIMRAAFLLLALAGLGILAANVGSIYAVYGERVQQGMLKAIVVAVTDELLMSQMIAAGALFVVGVVGLVLTSVLSRPKAAKADTEGEAEPEGAAEG